jgi:hypothetical protein
MPSKPTNPKMTASLANRSKSGDGLKDQSSKSTIPNASAIFWLENVSSRGFFCHSIFKGTGRFLMAMVAYC